MIGVGSDFYDIDFYVHLVQPLFHAQSRVPRDTEKKLKRKEKHEKHTEALVCAWQGQQFHLTL